MMQPKRTKYRKQMKGRNTGLALRGSKISFGEFGLKAVESGKVSGFIGALSMVAYQIQNNYIGQLKITGKFDETLNLAVATRSDESILNNIFNKAIEDITPSQKQEILNKWVLVEYQKELDYSSLYKILAAAVILIFILILLILMILRLLTL